MTARVDYDANEDSHQPGGHRHCDYGGGTMACDSLCGSGVRLFGVIFHGLYTKEEKSLTVCAQSLSNLNRSFERTPSLMMVATYVGTNASSIMAIPFADFNRVGLCGR